mmetsp:Transcript_135753/g.321696  ORF Transcript_135753/g.321696 Transcript_135753/m.321696 type:complete len:206 (-) Transcript_135753:385-1002(-)
MVPVMMFSVLLCGGFHFVGHVVLAAGGGLDVVRILWCLLKALDKILCILACDVWILAWRFNISAPARLSGKIDDGRPEGGISVARIHGGTGFPTNLAPNQLPESSIETHACRDGKGKLGGFGVPGRCHSRGSFGPPIVPGQAQGWDGRRVGAQRPDLLRQRHAAHGVGHAIVQGQRGVAEGELGELAPARVHHLRVRLWRRFRGT